MVTPKNILLRKAKQCFNCGHNKMSENTYRRRIADTGIELIGEYTSVHDRTYHKCSICGRTDWLVQPSQILYNGVRNCIRCAESLKESKMAAVLKQVCKHEYNEVYFEYDAGFITPKGGRSRYDIYIKDTNTLIECQSNFHDDVNSIIKDSLKRRFALDNGYNYLEIDNREYTELQAIRLLFPYMSEVPSYVNLVGHNGYNKIIDVEKAQKLLDECKTYKQIADELGITTSMVDKLIQSGKIIRHIDLYGRSYKEDYNRIVVAIDASDIEVIDLSKIGTTNKNEYNKKCYMVRACKGKGAGIDGHIYNNRYWLFKEDYDEQTK